MVRAFIILLLMAIFFLSGAVFGMKESVVPVQQSNEPEQQAEVTTTTPIESIEEKEEDIQLELPNNDDPEQKEGIELASSSNLTHKTASALEAGVQVFYETVVNILYGIATLFF